MNTLLPGLRAPGCRTPTQRISWLASAPLEELTGHLVEQVLATRAVAAELGAECASQACLPEGEVLASPFGMRAVVMGAREGVVAVHHETRAIIPVDPEFVDDAVIDPMHGVWDGGELRLGKYQSFFQDEPFIRWNPNHSAKWTPHEMLHRASGFFARDTMTKWEFYIGSRLNEIAPVALWYGADEFLRLERSATDVVNDTPRLQAPRELCRWIYDDEDLLRERARREAHFVRESAAHFEAEMDAIRSEIADGQRIVVPHPRLNSSSDALAYVVGHYNRVVDALRHTDAYALVPPGVQSTDVREYTSRIESIFDGLFFADLAWSPVDVDEKVMQRDRWDISLRAERLTGPDVDWPRLGQALAGTTLSGDIGAPAAMVPGILASGRLGGAAMAGDWPREELRQLEEGLTDVLPVSCENGALDAASVRDVQARGPVAERARRTVSGAAAAVVDIELLLLRQRDRRCDMIERLAEYSPGLPATGRIAIHSQVLSADVGRQALEAFMQVEAPDLPPGIELEAGTLHLAAAGYFDELRISIVEPGIADRLWGAGSEPGHGVEVRERTLSPAEFRDRVAEVLQPIGSGEDTPVEEVFLRLQAGALVAWIPGIR